MTKDPIHTALVLALRGTIRDCETVLDRIGQGQRNPPMYTVLRALRDDARAALAAAGEEVAS